MNTTAQRAPPFRKTRLKLLKTAVVQSSGSMRTLTSFCPDGVSRSSGLHSEYSPPAELDRALTESPFGPLKVYQREAGCIMYPAGPQFMPWDPSLRCRNKNLELFGPRKTESGHLLKEKNTFAVSESVAK
jgi:hypothetical protein